MAAWWRTTPKDRPQGKRPDPELYGLDVASIRKDFAFYHDQFVDRLAGSRVVRMLALHAAAGGDQIYVAPFLILPRKAAKHSDILTNPNAPMASSA